ncbi:MAG: hypothetical protein ICV60_12675 [Pyrinomonadaceae bacterium]|nr:hypothetical protein [Pyrinomonadaceae bacterium]
MMQGWSQAATSRYQDHVIAHVLGATALGYFILADAAYVLLDIALIWTIYTSGEMALMPQAIVISDLDADEDVKRELLADAELLHQGETERLARMLAMPAEFLINDVKIFEQGKRRRVSLEAEETGFIFEGLPDMGEIKAVFSKGDYDDDRGF